MNNFCSCKYFLLLFFLPLSVKVFAQYSLQLNVKLPNTHSSDSVFVAGNFNQWDPGNTQYQLKANGDVYSITITGLKQNIYEFKFTRGDWKRSEVDPRGEAIGNRLVRLISDTALDFSVIAWGDDFLENEKQHTASQNVKILDTAFFIPQLYRSRRIWIYLPPGYHKEKKRYPVLYMHDGQNLFDEYTSGYGEWGVDECLDSLIKQGKPAGIVIGIDNGSNRLTEYNPYDSKDFGKAEGMEYIQFVVETLKPYIDKHYRTLSSKKNTIIAGSSMGGLISYYAMITHPEVFGKAGIFSPSFWIAPKINALTDSLGSNLKGQLFFFAGGLEGETVIPDMEAVAAKLGENSKALIYLVTDPEGRHNEQTWRKWFAEFYLWIMGNGINYQIKATN